MRALENFHSDMALPFDNQIACETMCAHEPEHSPPKYRDTAHFNVRLHSNIMSHRIMFYFNRKNEA